MKYYCDNHKPIEAEDMSDAAHVFALRLARRVFGRRGRIGAFRLDSIRQDGTGANYNAFLGKAGPERNTTFGRNFWLYVYTSKE